MLKILVIDDNQLNRDIIEHYLTFEGYEVVTAQDGDEGIRMIEEITPDLVITDMIMPVRNGAEVVVHLKYHHPGTKVIVLTSSEKIFPKDHLSMIIGLGADAILTKPYTRREIITTVAQVVNKEWAAL